MKITTKGQVTIPQELRVKFGLLPHTEVIFHGLKSGVVIRPARSRREAFHDWLKRATGAATVKISTDEIMKMTRGEN